MAGLPCQVLDRDEDFVWLRPPKNFPKILYTPTPGMVVETLPPTTAVEMHIRTGVGFQPNFYSLHGKVIESPGYGGCHCGSCHGSGDGGNAYNRVAAADVDNRSSVIWMSNDGLFLLGLPVFTTDGLLYGLVVKQTDCGLCCSQLPVVRRMGRIDSSTVN